MVPASSHGVSSDGGFGFFIDRSGDDIHDAGAGAVAPAFGQTSSVDFSTGPRAGASALAAFFDLAGKDQYPGAPQPVGDGSRWRLGGLGWAPKGHVGLGWDS
ncbi:MAG TPA: hypothetical protein VM142_00525 [Acidimicrobiales bacterium]|nr:hypothetical protein [Acidimicrobiales bacterium]